jgi:5-deoxy-glucuronate isomerase
MLSETLVRAPRTDGLQLLQRRGERGARELTTHRVTLSAGGTADVVVADEETVVVLLEGRGRFEAGGQSWTVQRRDVFTDRATALLLPPGIALTVTADRPLEALLISTPAPAGGGPVLCAPEDIAVVERGMDLYRREVRNLFTTDPHARRLMVGETVNATGNWSSYPPHKHDGTDGELRLEEAYYYRIDPPGGFGLHISYTASGEAATHQVRDGDLVLIPYGYHSVCAPPRYDLYYLWAIAGEERRLAVYEDPEHRWVHSSDGQLPPYGEATKRGGP